MSLLSSLLESSVRLLESQFIRESLVTSPKVTMSFIFVTFSVALDSVCCSGYRWLLHRIDAFAVVSILVLDLCNFQLQTNNYTSRICSYSVVIDSLRVEPFPAV